ncbi:MAG: hypothetical protein QOD00_2512 [Blastocatellia bacterium]|jgi:hypothetical protein|nr:hypothetical protein [Blastocatellia bacterium]
MKLPHETSSAEIERLKDEGKALRDLIEEKFASERIQREVRELEEKAQSNIESQSRELILAGHALAVAAEAGRNFRPDNRAEWGIDGEIELKNDKGEASDKRDKALDLSRPGAVDLSYDGFKKRGKMVQLTDYFAEADILKALLADTIIQKALKSSGKPRPQTLAALMKAVYLQSVPVGECDYELSDDLLTRFAFHHLENERVAVRLGLSHAVETCRGSLVELGILLPIPAALKQPLLRAQSGTAGFLMKDQKKIAREQITSFTFTTEKSGKP